MAQCSIAQRGILTALALTALAGCTSVGNLLEGDKINYKSAGKAPTLEVPPDLTQLQRDNRYTIPEANRGTATASGFNLEQGARPANSTAPAVIAPKASADMKIERAGSQRWLVVKQTPEVLWPQLKDFWQEAGFLINVDTPEAGVMETDWAENRAKIPQDFIRNSLGKVLDSLYSTGERDKFRTRLERAADGSTEIYLSHRGAQEVLVGSQKDGTVWTPRPSDPELEAEFLGRMMARLGADTTRTKAAIAIASATPVQARAKLNKVGTVSTLDVDEGFDRAWRRVGLALDRVGFTVEDRDRIQGVYFVRYVDQGKEAGSKDGSPGFFARMFSGSSDEKSKAAQRYRVVVKAAGTANSQVSVQTGDGKVDTSTTGDKILSLLNEQLK
ncbi:MAG: outer membrane protein assembly factor BamC [Herminiimonas sp.]|nr:outer membrane protein assembly factor BamC [Herminiimonas sp.]